MINEPRGYDSNQLARMLGEVRLSLPPVFRAAICKAVDGLSINSGKVSAELKDLIIGQVALTLRASDFSHILEAEAERHANEQATSIKVIDHQALAAAKRLNADIVDPFFRLITTRALRTPFQVIKEHYESILYRCDYLDDHSAALLRTWATDVYQKFQKLTGVTDET